MRQQIYLVHHPTRHERRSTKRNPYEQHRVWGRFPTILLGKDSTDDLRAHVTIEEGTEKNSLIVLVQIELYASISPVRSPPTMRCDSITVDLGANLPSISDVAGKFWTIFTNVLVQSKGIACRSVPNQQCVILLLLWFTTLGVLLLLWLYMGVCVVDHDHNGYTHIHTHCIQAHETEMCKEH